MNRRPAPTIFTFVIFLVAMPAFARQYRAGLSKTVGQQEIVDGVQPGASNVSWGAERNPALSNSIADVPLPAASSNPAPAQPRKLRLITASVN